jgi:spore coat protein U-like protein
MRRNIEIALGLCALSGLAAPVLADSANTNLGVSASVATTCSISTSAVAFGTFGGSEVDATGTVTANCITGTAWTIGLGAGNGTGATTSSRKLTSGANTLGYQLFSDAGHANNWGNNVGTDTVAGTGTGASQNQTVYGVIPAGSTPAGGSYADIVVATINF